MKLEDVNRVYFIGIGGIGMSALARWFNQRGALVAGYDRTSTPLTLRLESEGILVHYEDNTDLMPDWVFDEDALVIYTPAIPSDHKGWNHIREGNKRLYKRSEVLGIITEDHHTIAVAGTHGKTTTSSMIAHILNGGKRGCSAFIGGIMTNYDSNLIVGAKEAPVVVEADEFDRSFMRLHPNFSVVTSIDPDHLDIYGHHEEMKSTYKDFMKLSGREGTVILEQNVSEALKGELSINHLVYGKEAGDYQAQNIRIEAARFVFDYVGKEVIKDISLKLPGYHNVLNATAAITAALASGMDSERVKERMESYAGVKRRFEYILDQPGLTYIDDYAHHPSEIKAFLTSIKVLYPGRKSTVIFQPHLYSRTNDFYKGFAESLSIADEVILLDIYPARELPMKGVTSEMIKAEMKHPNVKMNSLSDFPGILEDLEVDVLLTVGAGDIDTLVPKIKSHYQQKVTS